MWKPAIRRLPVTPFVTHMYGLFLCAYCVFSRDVMAPIFVSQNNETAAMSVSQNNPVGVKFFSYVNAFFCSNKFCIDAGHVSENTEYMRVCEKMVIYLGIKTLQRKERTQVYVNAWTHLSNFGYSEHKISAENLKNYVTSMDRKMSPRYNQVVMVSVYSSLTAVN